MMAKRFLRRQVLGEMYDPFNDPKHMADMDFFYEPWPPNPEKCKKKQKKQLWEWLCKEPNIIEWVTDAHRRTPYHVWRWMGRVESQVYLDSEWWRGKWNDCTLSPMFLPEHSDARMMIMTITKLMRMMIIITINFSSWSQISEGDGILDNLIDPGILLAYFFIY